MVQEGRTVNLVSTDSRQVQGRTVALATTLSVPALCPVRPAISTPFAHQLPSNPWNDLSRVARFYEGWMDGWMNGVRSPPRTAVCIHPSLSLFSSLSLALPLSLFYLISFGFLSDYSPSERRANNNPAMTCSLGRPPPIFFSCVSCQCSPFRRDESTKENARRVGRTNVRLKTARLCLVLVSARVLMTTGTSLIFQRGTRT